MIPHFFGRTVAQVQYLLAANHCRAGRVTPEPKRYVRWQVRHHGVYTVGVKPGTGNVKAFQRAHGLTPDGIVGPLTRAAGWGFRTLQQGTTLPNGTVVAMWVAK